MGIIRFSIRHPVTVSMATIAVVLFGFVSLGRLSVNLLPEISYPTLTIQTEYADAAPAEVEAFITEPLEEAVAVVQGLRKMHSVSQSGMSQIVLEFAWDTEMDYASLDVREKIDLVRLPDDASPPILLRFDPTLDPVLRVAAHGDSNMIALRHWVDRTLKKDLEALDGVASARVQGGLVEEIHVDLDEGKMALLGVSITDVTRVVSQNNINASGGRLRDRDAEFLVRTLNELADVDDIQRVILLDEEGRRVTLGDVARVDRGWQEREIISRVNGRECVQVSIYKEGDSNTVRVAQRVRDRLDWLQQRLPPGVETTILFDQSVFIENSINEVRSNAIIGGILAVLILFLFLKDPRSTMIIAMSIPVSIVATFVLMRQMNVTLNIMSLGGLALGVGMLVDNSIVVLEAIARHRKGEDNAPESAERGANEVGRAVVASTLTTVAVFLPIVFVEGVAGQIFKDQALTVTFSLIVSLIVALTLIPMVSALRPGYWWRLASVQPDESAAQNGVDSLKAYAVQNGEAVVPMPRVLRLVFFPLRLVWFVARWIVRIVWLLLWPIRQLVWLVLDGLLTPIIKGIWRYIIIPLVVGFIAILRFLFPFYELDESNRSGVLLGSFMALCRRTIFPIFDAAFSRVQTAYTPLLDWALAHRAPVLLGTGALFAVCIALVPMLGMELIPSFTQGEFTFEAQLPDGTPLPVTDATISNVERNLVHDRRLRTVFVDVGGTDRLGADVNSKKPSLAQINVVLKERANNVVEERVVEDIRGQLESIEDLDYEFRRPSYFSFRTPIEIEVYGFELDDLAEATDVLVQRLRQVPGLRDVRASLQPGSPEVQIAFNRARVSAMDLDIDAISRTLRNKIRGDAATRLKERDRQIDILVRTERADRIDIGQVGNLVVAHAEGIPVMLSSVADIAVERGPSQIEHLDQQRAALVYADLAGRDLGSVSRDIDAVLASTPLPGTVTAELTGQNEELQHSFRSLILAVLLAVFMVYIVMASQFESLLHPFVILGTVPLALIGVILALALTGTTVSVVVFLGVIMLSGIVVNNSIVLVDYVNRLRQRGRSKIEALREGASVRLRPILMTTLTTVLGLTPMALGFGEGAEIRAPMAIAVIGGLTLSTLLTLVVIPVFYSVVDRRP
ncbi:MAG: efflux RND transporter permease subunit [Candidatus Latescibacterota bacterium]|nr:MAG: efflux RND transporter permease subunit [Candidatus Latescibacterota bacterium]